eukprot:TRINITY_DN11720_c1_g1_i1.p2 TRINITY_DN11720_c1_g1~~TRINITY_DN11720_c1_g1_i1.p2  ORF type:complete len:535 (+),score=180.29 TRINITY_DN11720_c1_g1_i1:109-1605(+)
MPQQGGSGWSSGWQSGGWGGGRPGDRMGGLGMGLHEVNWGQQELVTVKKNTYQPSATTDQRKREDIDQWRGATGITVDVGRSGIQPPNPILTFAEANLPPHIHQLFRNQGFVEPTPIQAQAWPIAMSGHNMVGIAKTGSGKTLAFGIPAVMHITQQPEMRHGDGPVALFLAPTRELCMQIEEETRKVAHGAGMRTAAVYGGVPKGPQIREQRGAAIITATPGRMIDFLENGLTNLRRCSFSVLDEADRMLDMGFEPQIRSIMSQVRPDRQTLMFSATWPKEVRSLAQDFLQDWVQLNVGYGDMAANADVRQHIWFMEPQDKQRELLNLLSQLQGNVNKVLIFVQTKHGVEALCDYLGQQSLKSLTIHGDKTQQQRDHALSIFRRSQAAILIATDVAQRGLDIRGLPAVINFDFPDCMEDYIHRIGRTGRAGDIGDAYSFFTPQNAGLAKGLVRVLEKAAQPIDPFLRQVAQASGGKGGGRNRYGKGGYGGGKGKGRRW